MKKNGTPTKTVLLYDKLSFTVIAIGFFVMLFFHILQIMLKWEISSNSLTLTGRYHLQLQTLPYLLFPIFLLQLRFRKITSKGVYATFIGIPYKHIRWDKVAFCKIDTVKPWICGDRQKEDYRDMIFFKSRFNHRYKATTISMDATSEVMALTKKYYKNEIYDLTQTEEE